jgi:hypothetical protein
MEDGMIQRLASAARIAGARMTTQRLKVSRDSLEQASRLLARSQRDRKAAAHAEIFDLLAEVVDDRGLAPVLRDGKDEPVVDDLLQRASAAGSAASCGRSVPDKIVTPGRACSGQMAPGPRPGKHHRASRSP